MLSFPTKKKKKVEKQIKDHGKSDYKFPSKQSRGVPIFINCEIKRPMYLLQ